MKGHNIGYIRVSHVDQNIARQLEGLDLHKTFVDKCSGKDKDRPQLNLLIDFVRDGDTVYIHSLDRLARNLEHLKKIVNILINKGVTVKFIKENLVFTEDEQNPISELMLSVMGAFAQFERELIKERQREGILIAKKAGKYKGRRKILTIAQVEEMRQMVADRYKKVDIAKKFGISRMTLSRYLNSNCGLE